MVEPLDVQVIFTMGDDSAGEVEEFGEAVDLGHVFEGAGPIFGGEKVIAILDAEAFADVFEAVGVGPADADGFFGQGKDLLFGFVKGILGFDPANLITGEVFSEERVGVDLDEWEDGAHGIFDF